MYIFNDPAASIIMVGIILGFITFIWNIIMHFVDKLNLKKEKPTLEKNTYFNTQVFLEYEKSYENNQSFRTKADSIKNMIMDDKIDDIKEIANNSNSSLEECIMIIAFLENKEIIPNLYINTRLYKLVECSHEDEVLLKKYSSFLSRRSTNYSVNNGSNFNFSELLYLYKKGLVSEIEIDEENKQIIFLDLSKNQGNDFISVVCSNCGALNDVNRGQKVTCKYCGSKIIGPKK